MEIDVEKLLKEDSNAILTPRMKQSIYVKYLEPLKQRITDILLYDEETANEFLLQYNSMIEKDLGLRILRDITLLEEKVENYEKEEGKLRRYKHQSRILIRKIKELQTKVQQMKLQESEYEFKSIKEMYDGNVDDYEYKEKDKISQQIYLLQAKFIARKVVEEQVLDLYCDISQEDENGLKIVLNNEIHKLLQSEDTQMQDLGNEIRYNMLSRTDAVYDSNIWKIFAKREKGVLKFKNPSTQNKEKTQFINVYGILKQRFENMINTVALSVLKITEEKEDVLPIKTEKLSGYSNLSETEKNLFYRFLVRSNRNAQSGIKMKRFNFCYDRKSYILEYMPADAMEKECLKVYKNIYGTEECVALEKGIIDAKELLEVISYAKFLDTIKFNASEIELQLLEEIGKFIIETSKCKMRETVKQLNKLHIFGSLKGDYNILKQEIGEIQYDKEISKWIESILVDTSKISNSSSAYGGVQQENVIKSASEDIEEEK